MRSGISIGLISAMLAAGVVQADELPVVPKDAKLEKLFTRTANVQGGLTEGPAAAPDGSIYFTDIPLGNQHSMILRFDPQTMKTTVFSDDSGKANGMEFDARGNLVACEGADYGRRRISRWNVAKKTSETIADRYQGKRLNSPNDLIFDSKGRIYFTDPRYAGPEPCELEHRAVYRLNPDGSVIEITHEVEMPNGIALSPDEKTLYVIDHNSGSEVVDPTAPPPKTGAMKVYSFPLGPDGLVAGPRKTLLDFGSENGCDGMCLDRAGRLYIASRSLKRPGILIVEPSGKEVGFIPTGPPNQQDGKTSGIPSNCEFGIGDAANILYVTADTSLYRVRLNTQGYRVTQAKK